MAANTIITSIVTGGTNSHTTVAEEANSIATDFVTQGVVGAITLNSGSGGTGSFCVNQYDGSSLAITIKSGQAYITATPSSQDSQVLRARASSDYTNYAISTNTSGVTKYDWIYLKVDATKANNPASDASDVTSIYTSRSSSNTSDNGTPPTYGLLLAVVTVANGASAITNSNISDQRFNTSIGAQNGSLIVTQQATGDDAIIQAAGTDANINVSLDPKGTGVVSVSGSQIGQQNFKDDYKFSVYRNSSWTINSATATKIAYDTKTFDTGTNFDVATNHRFTAPVAGFYFFSAGWQASIASASGVYAMLYKNGSEVLRGSAMISGAGTYVDAGTISGLLQLAASDYVEVYGYQTGANAAGSTGSNLTWFHGFMVSSL